MKTLRGWIYNVYASGQRIVVQVVDTDNQVHRLLDRFAPAFWIGGDPKECRAAAGFILEQPWNVRLSYKERPEPSLSHPVQVLQVEVENPHHFALILERVKHFKPKLTFYGADIPFAQMYLSDRKLAPLTLSHFAVDDENRILGIECNASITAEKGK